MTTAFKTVTVRSEGTPSSVRVTTSAQYQHAVEIAMRERRVLRRGQAFFDVLSELEPELAARLTGTADDPFYDDSKLPAFLLRVAEELR